MVKPFLSTTFSHLRRPVGDVVGDDDGRLRRVARTLEAKGLPKDAAKHRALAG